MKRSRVLAAVLVASATLIPGAARADEVTDWTEQMFRANVVAATSPLNVTRGAAIVQTAIFDAVNGIEKKYSHIRVAPAAPSGASKNAAADAGGLRDARVVVPDPEAHVRCQAGRLHDRDREPRERRVDSGRRDVGPDGGRRHHRLAEHRRLHAAAASVHGRPGPRTVAPDAAGQRVRRGTAVRLHDALGDPVAVAVPARRPAGAEQRAVCDRLQRDQDHGQRHEHAPHP